MSKLLLAEVGQGRPTMMLEIDRSRWSQSIGDGGFGIAYKGHDDPHHILKCMDEPIDRVEWSHSLSHIGRLSEGLPSAKGEAERESVDA